MCIKGCGSNNNKMMFQNLRLVIFLLLGLLFVLTNGQQSCNPPIGKPACVCATADGTIDLTSLSSTDNTPQFANIPDSGGNTQFTYSYNPCTGYNEGDYSYSCGYQSVAACQAIDQGGYSDYYSLGDPSTETMYIDSSSNDIFLQYDNGDDGRVTKVHLICDENADPPTITADGDGNVALTYEYHLTTKCACPNGCSDDPIPTTDSPGEGGGGGKGSGSRIASGYIGIILILLFIIGFVTYFVIGAIVLNKKYEKQGKEMIPQKDFWLAIPFLVKDGCVFTFKPIVNLIRSKTGKGGGGDGYEPLT